MQIGMWLEKARGGGTLAQSCPPRVEVCPTSILETLPPAVHGQPDCDGGKTHQRAVPGERRTTDELAPGHAPGTKSRHALAVPGLAAKFLGDRISRPARPPETGKAYEQQQSGGRDADVRVRLCPQCGTQENQRQHARHHYETMPR